MSTVRIVIRGKNNSLFTRKLKTETQYQVRAVEAKAAVEHQPATLTSPGRMAQEAVEAVEYKPYKAAEWTYTPFQAEYDFEACTKETGSNIFQQWLGDTDQSKHISDDFDVAIEKEVFSYTVTANMSQTGTITSEMADEHDINDEDDAYTFARDNSFSMEWEDEGDVTDIEVEQDYTEYVRIEWE